MSLAVLLPTLLALAACTLDRLYAETELFVAEGSIHHVTLVLSESAADGSDVSFGIYTGDNAARVMIVPDDDAIDVLEVTGSFDELDLLAERCQRAGPCRLGFTIDVVEADAPFELQVQVSARRGARYDEADFIAIEIDD